MSTVLTAGSISQIMTLPAETKIPEGSILQILTVSELPGATGGRNRWKTTISDGTYSASAMVTGNAATRIASGEIKMYSLVRFTSYQVNHVGLRRVIIILDFDLVSQQHAQIGVVSAFPEEGANPVTAASATAPAPASASAAAPAAASASHHGGAGAYGGAGSGAVVRPAAPAGGSYMPIAQLNPYNNRWTIKVRVQSKGDVRTWNNERSSGKLFKIDLIDEANGEISAAFFKEAVDRYYDQIHVGSVYLMSGGRVKPADKRYSGGKEYEINFDEKSQVTPCGDDGRIKTVHYDFVRIADLPQREPKSNVDVIGLLKAVGDVTDIQSKAGKALTKRDISFFDDSAMSVDATLWGDVARNFQASVGDIVAFKNAQLSDWNGRSLSTIGSTVHEINPQNNADADRVRAWGASNTASGTVSERGAGGGGGGAGTGDSNAALTDLSKRKALSQITEADMRDGRVNGDEVMVVKATVEIFRRAAEDDKPLWYTACKAIRNDRTCQKKLADNGGGSWTCVECGYQTEPEYRYILPVRLYDQTSSTIATFFNNEASQLIGMTGDELHSKLQNEFAGDHTHPDYEAILKRTMFKEYICFVKAKMEMVKDMQKLKLTVIKIRPMEGDSQVKESRALINAIKAYIHAP